MMGKHDTIGIDLVAMNVDDVVASGAQPIFFLDYIAGGKLEPDLVVSIVQGGSRRVRSRPMCFVGRETAQMPIFTNLATI